jgi:protein TonB
MAAYAQDNQFFSRRLIVLFIIVAFHVLLIWALANGLAHHIVELIAPPIQTNIIEEVKKQDQPPPPPPPQLERPPVEIPKTDIAIDLPVETTSTALSNTTTEHVVRAPPPPPAPPHVAGSPAKVNIKGFPNSEDFYPPSSRRLEETGSPVVKVCVDQKGKILGEPTIQTSSNFPKLDEAAIKLAKAGQGHYIAGTENGQPLPESCIAFRVVFKFGS